MKKSWWKLGWSPHSNALKISIAETFIATLPPIPEGEPILVWAQNQLLEDLFGSFSYDLKSSRFGFNGSIFREPRQSEDGFVCFLAPLPRIHIQTNMACAECGGTGKRLDYPDEQCCFCSGSRQKNFHDWGMAFNLTSSLQLLFSTLWPEPTTEMPTQVPQWLLGLRISSEQGRHGSSISGVLSEEAVQIFDLLRKSDRHMGESIWLSMVQTWKHMMGKVDNEHRIRVETRDGNLYLTSPGDGSGVYTKNYDRAGGGGEISSHNMDDPAQALACLAGLGVFCEALEVAWNQLENS